MVVEAFLAVGDRSLTLMVEEAYQAVEDLPSMVGVAYQVLEDQPYDLVEHALDLVAMMVSPFQALEAFLREVEGLHLRIEEASVVKVQN